MSCNVLQCPVMSCNVLQCLAGAAATAAASAAAIVATTVKTVVKTRAAAEAAAVAAAVAAAPAAASVSEEKNSWTLNIIRFLVFVTLFLHGGVGSHSTGTARSID